MPMSMTPMGNDLEMQMPMPIAMQPVQPEAEGTSCCWRMVFVTVAILAILAGYQYLEYSSGSSGGGSATRSSGNIYDHPNGDPLGSGKEDFDHFKADGTYVKPSADKINRYQGIVSGKVQPDHWSHKDLAKFNLRVAKEGGPGTKVDTYVRYTPSKTAHYNFPQTAPEKFKYNGWPVYLKKGITVKYTLILPWGESLGYKNGNSLHLDATAKAKWDEIKEDGYKV